MDKTSSIITTRARIMVGHIFKKRKRLKLIKGSLSREGVKKVVTRTSCDNLTENESINRTLTSAEFPSTNEQRDPPPPQVNKLWERNGTKSVDNLQDSSVKIKCLETENGNLRLALSELGKRLKVVNKQLEQERGFYEEQRWSYLQEIKATIKQTSSVTTQTKQYIDTDDEDADSLANELRKARLMFYKQRSMTCSLSEKFLRLRDHKDRLSHRLRRLEMVYTAVIDELLKHVAELRVNFASIENGQLLDKNAVARLVDRDAKLSYNNAILHLEILKFEKRFEAMKNRTVNYKDAFEVEKFLQRCRSHRLLQICGAGGGDGNYASLPVMKIGSLINIPVAVHVGDRIETKLIPLFGIVRVPKHDEDSSNGKKRQLIEKKLYSVPSKVWRYKNVKTLSIKKKKRRKSAHRPDSTDQIICHQTTASFKGSLNSQTD